MSFRNAKIAGIGVNSSLYHTQDSPRGTAGFYVSPSSLKLFADCPSRFIAGYNPPDSDAKTYGSLLDTLLLTPEQFDGRYAVKPEAYKDAKTGEEKPWNGNSNACKVWLADHADLEVVSKGEVFEVQSAIARLKGDETIAALLDASDKQVHVTGEWLDERTGIIIPVQCLIDLVPRNDSEFQKNLGDLKSTRNAGLRPFARWCYTAGYHIQAAFDLDLYQMATRSNPKKPESGEDRSDWLFIIQENYPPYEMGRRLLSQDFLQIGRQTYQHALGLYARCMKTGNWTSYDPPGEFSIIDAEPFMEFNALSEKLEDDQREAEGQTNDVPMP